MTRLKNDVRYLFEAYQLYNALETSVNSISNHLTDPSISQEVRDELLSKLSHQQLLIKTLFQFPEEFP